MRQINRLLATLLIAAATLIAGCEKPTSQPTKKPMAVTYAALNGCWKLTKWQGEAMAEDTFLYIEFDRTQRRYTMWDNIDSMYATDTTGTYAISEEEDGTYTLTGTYDYGLGDWSEQYNVVLYDEGNTMLWRARGAAQTMEYVRVAERPEL